jgi:serine/threonine protein kinase
MSFQPENLPSDSPNTARQRLEPGSLIAGRFEVVESLAEGGMGEVFRVKDRETGRERALKMMRGEIGDDPELRKRFEREAEIATTLSHPNIVRTLGLHWHGGAPAIVMELLAGHSLRQEFQHKRASGARFTSDEMRAIARQTAAALEFAHRRIVHRDVKPENIWITESKTVCLMDFGLAARIDDRRTSFTKGLVGTDRYMAPEQRRGERADARADQYSLGVVLYELAAGEPPAPRSSPLREIRSDLPEGFCAAIERSLKTRPEDRFPSMDAFARALDSKIGPWNHRKLGVIAAALLAIAALASAPWWWPSAATAYRALTVDRARQDGLELARKKAEAEGQKLRARLQEIATEQVPTDIKIDSELAQKFMDIGDAQREQGEYRSATESFELAEDKFKSANVTVDKLSSARNPANGVEPPSTGSVNHGGAKELDKALKKNPQLPYERDAATLKSPLHIAVERGDAAMVAQLLGSGADVHALDRSRRTPLHLAMQRGNPDIVGLLLENGANGALQDEDGYTALHRAVGRDVRIVQMLLADSSRRDAMLNAPNDRTDQPIHLVAASGDAKTLEAFRQAGADFGARRVDGKTPLIVAADMAKTDNVDWMLTHIPFDQLQINAQDKTGKTALHHAAERDECVDIVHRLLAAGSDPCIRSKGGKRPIDGASPENARQLEKPCP